MSQPLSQSLRDVLTDPSAPSGLTLNGLLERTRGRGFYLVIVLLCLPFVVPVSIPGLSTMMGAIIVLLSLPLAIGRSPRLPRFLGERNLPPAVRRRVISGSISILRLLEKWARPRRTQWLAWPAAHFINCLLLAFLAILLALPLPSPPFFFSNSIPSYAIILLAASMMEEDGVLIWFGYGLFLANLVFFALIGGAVCELFYNAWQAIAHMTNHL